MKKNYKVVVLISFFLFILSVGSSVSYYLVSMNSMEKQLRTQSLPLSIDNIYTDIQKHIIEPYLVASMMASDTFMKDWLINEEENTLKIRRYLDSIKNKYGMLVSFLVSEKSQNYYTQDGLIETITEEKPINKWYFDFKQIEEKHEINLDLNDNIADTVIMFINFKILDDNFHYLGATGVGIKISYINEMLKKFRNKYSLKVMFLDKDGNIILSEAHKYGSIENIADFPQYRALKEKILINDSSQLEYKYNGSSYLLNTKYIKELDIHLLVEARLDDFTHATKSNFYINLIISLLFTFVIAVIIMRIVKGYNQKLEELADFDPLTKIPNRRYFTETMKHYFSLTKRTNKPLSLLFIDIDDFKLINDSLGHALGDEVLKEFAYILNTNTRESDVCARWGGEEFVLALMNTNLEEAHIIAQKINTILETSIKLKTLIPHGLTISTGITQFLETDTLDSFVSRADNAMYKAKQNGKNQVYLA